MKLNEKQLEYVNTAYEMFSSDTLEKSQIKQVNNKLGMKSSPAWLIKDPQFRLSRGVYKLPVNGIVNPSKNVKQEVSIPEVKQKISKQIQTTESASENLVPNKEDTFVPFGNYKDLKNIGYDELFVIPRSNLRIENEESVITSDMTASKMKQLFSKGFKQKKMSRLLLNKFIERVA